MYASSNFLAHPNMFRSGDRTSALQDCQRFMAGILRGEGLATQPVRQEFAERSTSRACKAKHFRQLVLGALQGLSCYQPEDLPWYLCTMQRTASDASSYRCLVSKLTLSCRINRTFRAPGLSRAGFVIPIRLANAINVWGDVGLSMLIHFTWKMVRPPSVG